MSPRIAKFSDDCHAIAFVTSGCFLTDYGVWDGRGTAIVRKRVGGTSESGPKPDWGGLIHPLLQFG